MVRGLDEPQGRVTRIARWCVEWRRAHLYVLQQALRPLPVGSLGLLRLPRGSRSGSASVFSRASAADSRGTTTADFDDYAHGWRRSVEGRIHEHIGHEIHAVTGTKVLFCIHETRHKDYAAFAAEVPGVNGLWKTQTRDGIPIGDKDDHPVVCVSWDDANAFCAWLTRKGRTHLSSAHRSRMELRRGHWP